MGIFLHQDCSGQVERDLYQPQLEVLTKRYCRLDKTGKKKLVVLLGNDPFLETAYVTHIVGEINLGRQLSKQSQGTEALFRNLKAPLSIN